MTMTAPKPSTKKGAAKSATNGKSAASTKSAKSTTRDDRTYDAIVIVTDHDDVDYGLLANHSRLIIDTRNAMQRANIVCDRVVKA